jgi:hypothetical protein
VVLVVSPCENQSQITTLISCEKNCVYSIAHSNINFFPLNLVIGKTSGFFAGCAVALTLALILIIRARNIMDKPGATQYMDNMFPLYRYTSSKTQ